jgi:enoyl-CoA hydratase
MTLQHILLEIRDRVAVITINRPPMNTLSWDTLNELETVLNEIETNPSIGSIILTGSGDKMFSAGADVTEFAEMRNRESAEAILRQMNDRFSRIETFSKPILACVNGKALGGGNELQMACHLAIAADTAEFGLPEVRLGIMPGYGGTQRLPKLVGRRRALDMMLTGIRISAQTALEYGLINYVAASDVVLDEAFRIASQLAAGPPLAIKGILDAVQRGVDLDIAQGLAIEREHMLQVATSEDAIEGVAAFIIKRQPEFKGR